MREVHRRLRPRRGAGLRGSGMEVLLGRLEVAVHTYIVLKQLTC